MQTNEENPQIPGDPNGQNQIPYHADNEDLSGLADMLNSFNKPLSELNGEPVTMLQMDALIRYHYEIHPDTLNEEQYARIWRELQWLASQGVIKYPQRVTPELVESARAKPSEQQNQQRTGEADQVQIDQWKARYGEVRAVEYQLGQARAVAYFRRSTNADALAVLGCNLDELTNRTDVGALVKLPDFVARLRIGGDSKVSISREEAMAVGLSLIFSYENPVIVL